MFCSYCLLIFWKIVYCNGMKTESKHNSSRPSKGQRLNWAPLKGNTAVKLSSVSVKSRSVTSTSSNPQVKGTTGCTSSLLVP
jgi:hypothetical protein